MKDNYIVGLDIGSQNVRVVQAKYDASSGSIQVIGAASVPAYGVRKGIIVDIEETVSSLSNALEKVERMTGIPVTHAALAVGGGHIQCMLSKGFVAVSRADGEVSESDFLRVIDNSQAVAIPPNRELLHVIPRQFTVDGQAGIKDPRGMSGLRLEVETLLITGGTPFLKNIERVVSQGQLSVDRWVLGSMAASESILNKIQKENGVMLLDVGAGTTSLIVFLEGSAIHTAVIPIGGSHITNDLAISLQSSIDTAETVKIKFGHARPHEISRSEQIELNKIHPDEQGNFQRTAVAEVIEARLDELLDFVKAELVSIGLDGKLPAGVVLTGGSSRLSGLGSMVKDRLRLPVELGESVEVQTIIDKVKEPSFAVSLGLALMAGKGTHGKTDSKEDESGAFKKIQSWFKAFLP